MQESTARPLAPASKSPLTQRIASRASLGCPQRTILVVENEEVQGLLYEQELNEEGYLIIWAGIRKEPG